jgi:hypothetical protein
MLATSVCLLFLALLCASVGALTLLIVREHLRDPDFLQAQWARHEQASSIRGIAPTRTPGWEEQVIRQEKARRFSGWGLIVLSVIIATIAIVSSRGV